MQFFTNSVVNLLRHGRTAMLVAGAGAALAVLAGGGAFPVENGLRTVRDLVRSHPASGEVHIVEIDKRSIEALRRWPSPRRYHARAVDRLVAAGAKTIAFDVDFSSGSDPVDDRLFAAALARAGGDVILPAMLQDEGAGSRRTVESEPIAILREHSFAGAVSIKPDSDGFVRSAPFGLSILGAPRPSLAAMLAEAHGSADRSFTIDYAIDPTSVPRHSFIDLIEGRVPPAALRGKRVVIGATAAETPDRYPVPGHGVIYGVVIQAIAAETLMAGAPGTLGWIAPLILAAAAIGLLASRRRRPLRIVSFAATCVIVLLLPLALESLARTSVEIVPAMAALAAAGGAASLVAVLRAFRRKTMVDTETGLPNVNALVERLEPAGEASIAVAHIAGFSETASACGPAITADLVRRVAERMAVASRGAAVHRVDEATLAWAVEADALDEIGDRFDALAALMRAPVEAGGRRVDVALSFGVASGAGDDVRQLVANAILAAANAAAEGARWRMFTSGNEEAAQWRVSLLGDLDAALERGHIWVAHQPKLDIATRRVIGSEALVRWQHETRGPIPPDLFIPAVEAHGRIGDLTLHVLRTALRDAADWAAGGNPFGVAVNISATLLAQPGIVEDVEAALRASGVPAERLTLEITESAALGGSDAAVERLEQLRDLGVGLSVDDYGTGQSTLTYLKRLPARELKIDKSFVQAIAASRSDAILVRSTIDLAHELGLRVVGEGVEDLECLEALAALGCDIAQGYHIGRPMAAADFLRHARALNAPRAPAAVAA